MAAAMEPRPQGDSAFRDAVYTQLRAIAQQQMNGERPGHTLSATALVHEAYLRLGEGPAAPAERGPSYVFAAAEAMRRILIEHARARGRLKRGGRLVRVSLDAIGDVADLGTAAAEGAAGVLAFDEAFRRLEEHDPGVADVVRLRFYAGLTVPETARAIGVAARTVDNRWAYARAWMARELGRGGEEDPGGSGDDPERS